MFKYIPTPPTTPPAMAPVWLSSPPSSLDAAEEEASWDELVVLEELLEESDWDALLEGVSLLWVLGDADEDGDGLLLLLGGGCAEDEGWTSDDEGGGGWAELLDGWGVGLLLLDGSGAGVVDGSGWAEDEGSGFGSGEGVGSWDDGSGFGESEVGAGSLADGRGSSIWAVTNVWSDMRAAKTQNDQVMRIVETKSERGARKIVHSSFFFTRLGTIRPIFLFWAWDELTKVRRHKRRWL